MNIRPTLFNQSSTGNNASIREMVAINVENNIKNDFFAASKINFPDSIDWAAFCNSYTVIASKGSTVLSLFDNLTFQMLWQSTVTVEDNYGCNGLLVSDSGVVLFTTSPFDLTSPFRPHVQIFAHGRKTGEFYTENIWVSHSLMLMNNRIFSCSPSNYLYEWNIHGKLTEVTLMDMTAGESNEAISNEYYILSKKIKGISASESMLRIFALNLHNNRIHYLDLRRFGFNNNNHHVSHLQIQNDKLFIAYYINLETGYPAYNSLPNDMGILVIDIETGATLNHYLFQSACAVIYRMNVNNDFIIFFSDNNTVTNGCIYSINRRTDTIEPVTKLLHGYSDVNLYLTRSLLTIITSRREDGFLFTDRHVVDLKEKQKVHRIEYLKLSRDRTFFGAGTYVTVTNSDNQHNRAIYIERFNSFSCDKGSEETLRTHRSFG